jgi:hypothetical protein
MTKKGRKTIGFLSSFFKKLSGRGLLLEERRLSLPYPSEINEHY